MTQTANPREVDWWLAERLFGLDEATKQANPSWRNHVEHYSTTGNGMLLVIEAMRERGWVWDISEGSFGPAGDEDHTHHGRLWVVALEPFDDSVDWRAKASAYDSLPEAVAEAATGVLAQPGEVRP